MFRRLALLSSLAAALLLVPRAVPASMSPGCADKPCVECHTLSQAEAEKLMKGLVDRVVAVRNGAVPGFYELDLEKGGRKMPVFLHYSKRYLVTGDVVDLETKQSLTKDRFIDLNRVEVATIPLDDAVVIGDPTAAVKIIVFDDPECPYCQKIHPEMKKVVEQRPDVAFWIKMLPLKIHPNARKKAEAILCAKSARMLEDSLAGKDLPEPSCQTDQIAKNEKEATRLGVRSTPTLVLPDGRVMPGYKPAAKIIELLAEGAREQAKK
jgi:thiol:disulfide interchange protein DsbC